MKEHILTLNQVKIPLIYEYSNVLPIVSLRIFFKQFDLTSCEVIFYTCKYVFFIDIRIYTCYSLFIVKKVSMKTSELQKLLKKNGCYIVRHGSNHDIWCSPITCKEFPVPRHPSQDVKKGTFNSIKKDAGF